MKDLGRSQAKCQRMEVLETNFRMRVFSVKKEEYEVLDSPTPFTHPPTHSFRHWLMPSFTWQP